MASNWLVACLAVRAFGCGRNGSTSADGGSELGPDATNDATNDAANGVWAIELDVTSNDAFVGTGSIELTSVTDASCEVDVAFVGAE